MSIEQEIIGLEKQAAFDLLQERGVTARIAHEDGKDNLLAPEYRPGSLVVTIVDGKIVTASPG